jgi:hypothetical protein
MILMCVLGVLLHLRGVVNDEGDEFTESLETVWGRLRFFLDPVEPFEPLLG